MQAYRCLDCGFFYDPYFGDPSQKIPPHTNFEALPKNWTCPTCGSPKNQFIEYP